MAKQPPKVVKKTVHDHDVISDEFAQRKPNFDRLMTEAVFALQDRLSKTDIKLHSTTSRVKTIDSFLGKVDRVRCEKPFEEIDDLVGVRIICLFLSDIERIGEIIRDLFMVVRDDNKIDNSKLNSFGYLSVHFIVRLGEEYKGSRYHGLTETPFEIQVRTIAMDAWANISHYLDYKTDQDIPQELKRDFYALSGMFYVADKHFQLFFEQRREKQEEIADIFEDGKSKDIDEQPLNLDTMTAFLHARFPDRKRSPSESVSIIVNELKQIGYKTIGQVNELLDKGSIAFEEYDSVRRGMSFTDVGVVRITAGIVDKNFHRITLKRAYGQSKPTVSDAEMEEHFEEHELVYEPLRKLIKND